MPDGHVVAMKDAEFQWLALSDPRLAAYAASRLPAWLWTADGRRILWANPAGARLFGAASAAALAEKTFGPADRHRRQIARLAGRLLANGAIRLERLQGFGAAPGMLATCGCSRFDFPNGSHGVLIAAGNIALIAPRRAQTQSDNEMQPATASSEPTLSEPVLSEAVLSEAVLQPSAPAMPVIEQPVAPQPAPDYQQPAPSGEAPAGFALFDAFAEPAAADEPPATETIARAPPPAIEMFAGQPVPQARRLPLRFTWQMDREGRFTLGTDEFTGLIGPRTTAAFGRPWREIAETFGLDPNGRVMQAFATGATWSGITLNWPVDGGGTLPVELSGLPVFDAARNFIGYRGFGVCRDFDAIARLAALRLAELSGEMVTPQEVSAAPSAEPASVASPSSDELPEPIAAKTSAAKTSAAEPSHQKDLETPGEQPAHSGEAPAEFALFDAFAEPATAEEPAAAEPHPADEPAAVEEPPPAETTPRAPSPAPGAFGLEAFVGQPAPQARRLPLRFTWQMDREGRFTLGTDEFLGLMGPRTTAAFGRPWREIAETFGFDPAGRMMQAFATGATWSGITLNWPVDGGGTLPVELSGLPIFDAARNFIGYRGFGVCRDFDALARLAALRLAELSGEIVTPQERVRCAICRAGQRCIAFIRRIA